MSFNSVNTNRQAVFALQSLNMTNSELSGVQKRVSTGYRVADARDDGGAFAVAQAVRSDIAGVTAVGEQLGGTRGILSTTFAALGVVSDTMKQVRGVLTRLADAAVTGSTRTQYETQYQDLVKQINAFIDDAKYNGRTLLANSTVATEVARFDITGIRNETGGTFTIKAASGAAMKLAIDAFVPSEAETTAATNKVKTAITTELAATVAGWTSKTDAEKSTLVDAALASADGRARLDAEISNTKVAKALAWIQPDGAFVKADQNISTALNQFGSSMQYVDNQITYNAKKMDAMNDGIGALVDADLAKESSKLQALQTRQQLGVQTLGIANQGPQVLLSLFR